MFKRQWGIAVGQGDATHDTVKGAESTTAPKSQMDASINAADQGSPPSKQQADNVSSVLKAALDTPRNDYDQRLESKTQKVLSFCIVLVTMLLCIVCVIMLSCTLTQTRVSSISLSGVNISVWKLDDVRKQWTTLRTQISTQTSEIETSQQESRAATSKSAAHHAVYSQARTRLDSAMAAFIARVTATDPSLAAVMQPQGPVERIDTLASAKDALLKDHPELEPIVKDILALGEPYKTIDGDRIALKSDADSRKAYAKSVADNLPVLQSALNSLFTSQFGLTPRDTASRVRIENALFELYSDGGIGRMINKILKLPPEIVTLFLVVLMGY